MKPFYKLILFSMLCSFTIQAQEKRFKEEFYVKPDVEINVKTRHCDIGIETWNKNKVLVEAFMLVEGEEVTEKMKDEFYKRWNFKAIGNKEKIDVCATSNSTIDVSSLDAYAPNYKDLTICLSDVSIGSLDILDDIDFEMPEPPEPPMPPAPPEPVIITEFDFDAYKNDKNYLEKWKEENKEYIGENARVKVLKNAISIQENNSSSSMLKSVGDEIAKALEVAKDAYKTAMKKYKIVRKEQLDEIREQANEIRRNALEARTEAMNERRKEIKNLLKLKSSKKVKRFIKITAPKDAKFNMDVKYGTMSIED